MARLRAAVRGRVVRLRAAVGRRVVRLGAVEGGRVVRPLAAVRRRAATGARVGGPTSIAARDLNVAIGVAIGTIGRRARR